jgi:2-keto-4-pentenoate hydratase/2-oxohepta-3-ene-1,7-dioic acid hydratase in catechol pathway
MAFPKEARMTRICARLMAVLALTVIGCGSQPSEQGPPAPYKLGMFEQGTRTFPGLVVGDSLVIDLSRANIAAPATLKELIAAWDQTMADRLGNLAGAASRQPPSFSYQLSEVTTLPPITDPEAMINAARNYEEHAAEMVATGRTAGTTAVIDERVRAGIPAIWTRRPDDNRGNPYLFTKLKSAITGNGDPIILPPGRTMIDWECELTVVMGREARRISVDQAREYIFGYTMMNDVSDREDRPDGRYGSDWLLGKSQDTFAPLGPFIVPAAFIPDPQNLRITFSLNDQLMQDSRTNLMTHTAHELVAYASHLATLHPGDLIATGTPGGVGTARVPPIYLKAGDRSVCTIEGIGTLANTVEALRTAATQ